VFKQMMGELRASRYAGDQIIAHNMALNVDIRGYHIYAFETVSESDSGRLIQEFLALPIPRLFLYGDANKALSYLPRLQASAVQVREIPSSAHFLFTITRWTHSRLLASLSMRHIQIQMLPPNHALQRTRPSCSGCNRRVPRAGSLSLGRSAALRWKQLGSTLWRNRFALHDHRTL